MYSQPLDWNSSTGSPMSMLMIELFPYARLSEDDDIDRRWRDGKMSLRHLTPAKPPEPTAGLPGLTAKTFKTSYGWVIYSSQFTSAEVRGTDVSSRCHVCGCNVEAKIEFSKRSWSQKPEKCENESRLLIARFALHTSTPEKERQRGTVAHRTGI